MEIINKIIFILSFLFSSCIQSPKPTSYHFRLSSKLAVIADQYYANFREPQDTVRFIQLMEIGNDTSKIILHCFGKDAFLMNEYRIIGIDTIKSGFVYIGVPKNGLIEGQGTSFDYAPTLREYCPWLIESIGDSITIISKCFQQKKWDSERTIKFEDIEK